MSRVRIRISLEDEEGNTISSYGARFMDFFDPLGALQDASEAYVRCLAARGIRDLMDAAEEKRENAK